MTVMNAIKRKRQEDSSGTQFHMGLWGTVLFRKRLPKVLCSEVKEKLQACYSCSFGLLETNTEIDPRVELFPFFHWIIWRHWSALQKDLALPPNRFYAELDLRLDRKCYLGGECQVLYACNGSALYYPLFISLEREEEGARPFSLMWGLSLSALWAQACQRKLLSYCVWAHTWVHQFTACNVQEFRS